jgi:hypothetical protein
MLACKAATTTRLASATGFVAAAALRQPSVASSLRVLEWVGL